mmetsp:Transcript_20439/g.28700  ORF Transcript_20439/g.28700 Transcript_20439/m.28700 type:complete len:112 (-) Transcript_20439:781-1116(-)
MKIGNLEHFIYHLRITTRMHSSSNNVENKSHPVFNYILCIMIHIFPKEDYIPNFKMWHACDLFDVEVIISTFSLPTPVGSIFYAFCWLAKSIRIPWHHLEICVLRIFFSHN